MKPFRMVFATFNAGKVREVSAVLAPLPVEVVGPREVGVDELPEETGETFLDNAVLKAADVFTRTGMPSFADDSGLEVPALRGAPGVHSARYAGPGHDDAANIAKLLAAVKGVEDRRARFVCTVACVFGSGQIPSWTRAIREGTVMQVLGHPLCGPGVAIVAAAGEVWGEIIDAPRGSNGFGYDPVFWRADLGRTFAELSGDEKNALSHRGAAFRKLGAWLEGAINPG